jgi:hypothetical protein
MRHAAPARLGVALLSRARGSLHGVHCVHGHFLPCKYVYTVRRCVLLTWMRDPVARLVSHYWYWKQLPEADFGPIHRRLHDEDWGLERFAREPRFHELYSRYLLGVPLERFAVIGITERYDASLRAIRRWLGREDVALPEPRRVSDSMAGVGAQLTPDLRRRIESCNTRDRTLYDRARRRNDELLARFGDR